MKTLRITLAALSIVAMLVSCDSKERAQLMAKVDSLNTELVASKKIEQTMNEVGALIDTIDANRRALNTKLVEGTSYADYVSRLKDINTHIQNTEKKLEMMEQSMKTSNRASAATVKRLKADLEARAQELVALQVEMVKTRDENRNLQTTLTQKDSVLVTKDETIKAKEGDITSLQGLVSDVTEQNKVKVANLYFAQAEALETAADRTKFAPRKKKETRREALELYKLSQSLGKTEAQEKIDKLEKELG